MKITSLIKEGREIAISNLNYSLNQLEAAGQLNAVQLENIEKFKVESEIQILDSYQLKLRYRNETVTVFIKRLSDPQGAVIVSLDNQAA